VLKDARLQQCDTPRQLYDRPANVFVARFIGSPAMSVCTVELSGTGALELGGARVVLPEDLRAALAARAAPRVVVGLRPEALELASDGLAARVEVVEELGADAYAFCVGEVGGEETRFVARADARRPPTQGDRVALRVRAGEAHLFDADSGERIGA
jgi:multiple sugar transport system ATP-binding protein